MIYINRDSALPPPIFQSPSMENAKQKIKDFYQQDPSIRRQQKYSNPRDNTFRQEFLPVLRDEFNGKCAYCESLINLASAHSEYDHFRPKQSARGFDGEASEAHYWWLVYDWNNIYYSCTKCNMYKSTWFPVEGERGALNTERQYLLQLEKNLLVDPCWNNPDEHFKYDLEGKLIGTTPNGVATIDIIKLNREDLVAERILAIFEIEESFKVFKSLTDRVPLDVPKLNDFFKDWREIFSDRCTKPYLGIRRYYIRQFLDEYEDGFSQYLTNRDWVMTTDEQLEEMRNRTPKEPVLFDYENAELISEAVQEMQKKVKREKHIFIDRIELKNFKCFSDLTVNFNNDVSSDEGDEDQQFSEPWILFLGENGVGKSSILKAFAIGLSGREYIKTLNIEGTDLLKSGTDLGFIKVHMVGGIAPAMVTFTENEVTSNIELPIIDFVAYNAIRLKHIPPAIVPEIVHYEGAKAKNLFDFTSSLIDSDEWLRMQSEERFDLVALTLKDLMSLDKEEHIVLIDGRAGMRRVDRHLYVDELSDGYQAIFHMAIDIMATIQKKDLPFYLAEGMIIIDEIGAHLHPRWRMEVVEKLRRAFPRMRFVVSTHEPLCLRGIRKGETVVLRKDEAANVQVLTDLPDPADLRVDQILTSDFFGLNSTMDRETEHRFKEYYELLAKGPDSLLPEDLERIATLKSQLPKIRYLGNNLRESIIYEVVDRLLADKKAKNSLENVESITQEAFLRLQKIWDIN